VRTIGRDPSSVRAGRRGPRARGPGRMVRTGSHGGPSRRGTPRRLVLDDVYVGASKKMRWSGGDAVRRHRPAQVVLVAAFGDPVGREVFRRHRLGDRGRVRVAQAWRSRVATQRRPANIQGMASPRSIVVVLVPAVVRAVLSDRGFDEGDQRRAGASRRALRAASSTGSRAGCSRVSRSWHRGPGRRGGPGHHGTVPSTRRVA